MAAARAAQIRTRRLVFVLIQLHLIGVEPPTAHAWGPFRVATRSPEELAGVGHELSTDLINYRRSRIRGAKGALTRHFGESRDSDHRLRLTSLAILVICLFE